MVQAPNRTSVYKVNPNHNKYTIGFAPELVPLILSGEKFLTYRFGNKYDYIQAGDKINVLNSKNNKIIGEAIVTNKFWKQFKDLPQDLPGHETYIDIEHHRKVLSGYYAYIGREIQDDDLFLVFEFKLI